VPDLPRALAGDGGRPGGKAAPANARPGGATPGERYALLADAARWSACAGHPGHTTPAVDEVVQRAVIPTMFARVARGEQSAEESVRAAEVEMRRIFARWSR
jgi:multiple sugar transport system substrate-binding protein